LIVFIAIAIIQPSFFRPLTFLGFLKRAAPILVVAFGQMYVMLSGEFDLSVGSLITLLAAIATNTINSDPANVGRAFLFMFLIAVLVGVVNGLITTQLRVPSFITTLGMLLILVGMAWVITKGAPRGSLTDNFRIFGRGNIGDIPIAVLVVVVWAALGVALMHFTTFGRRIYAIGGNPVASRLSGIQVSFTKTMAFVLCSVSAMVGAVLLTGFAGVSGLTVGSGYEFQAISAVVLGGVALTGGRGNIAGVIAGTLTLQAMFSLLNFIGFPLPIRLTVEGLILIGAVALAAWRERRV